MFCNHCVCNCLYSSSQGQCGITKKEMESILAKVHSKRQSTARESPDYWICQQEINTAVEEKLTGQKRGNEPDPRNKQMQGAFPNITHSIMC